MKPVDLLILLVMFLLLVLVTHCEAAAPKRALEFHVHTWAGMQRHRSGALDTGPAVGVSCGRFHIGVLAAQNRLGGYAGLRNLWLTVVSDTRTGRWEVGPALAIGF